MGFVLWLGIITASACALVRVGAVLLHVHVARFARSITASPAGTPLRNPLQIGAFSLLFPLFPGTCLLGFILKKSVVSNEKIKRRKRDSEFLGTVGTGCGDDTVSG